MNIKRNDFDQLGLKCVYDASRERTGEHFQKLKLSFT